MTALAKDEFMKPFRLIKGVYEAFYSGIYRLRAELLFLTRARMAGLVGDGDEQGKYCANWQPSTMPRLAPNPWEGPWDERRHQSARVGPRGPA